MSEEMGMYVEIGGELTEKQAVELIEIVTGEISTDDGPDSLDKLRMVAGTGPVRWSGTSNYGMADDTVAFCERNNLSYIHHSDSKYEYNAESSYWLPGMKQAKSHLETNDGETVVQVSVIKPLVELLLSISKGGVNALPLSIGRKGLDQKLIEKCIKHPKKALEYIEKIVRKEVIPGIPSLPPLIIKE